MEKEYTVTLTTDTEYREEKVGYLQYKILLIICRLLGKIKFVEYKEA